MNKSLLLLLVIYFCMNVNVQAAEVVHNNQTIAKLAQEYSITAADIKICLDKNTTDIDRDKLKSCLDKLPNLVKVVGRYIGLETPEVFGRTTLNRDFIESAPKSTGDIHELIALLPGVELSEDSFSVSESKEIRAKKISISGAQPWQTGFFLDGVNYNSRIDPASSNRSNYSVNEVRGEPQSLIINSDIVAQIDVYDNNIPAEYGDFSGGVVSVETLSPIDERKNRFKFGWRGTRSDWGEYKIFEADNQDSNAYDPLDDQSKILSKPVFKKNSLNGFANLYINKHHGALFSFNHTEADISEISFGHPKTTQRKNSNVFIKLVQQDRLASQLEFSVTYAPYENINFKKDVLNSEQVIDGGGLSSKIKINNDLQSGTIESEIQFSQADNSREAPAHYYIWRQQKGRGWGNQAARVLEEPVSLEGGFGDLEKQQQTFKIKSIVDLDLSPVFGADQNTRFGFEYSLEQLNRTREQDSYYYNSAIPYSAEPGDSQLNCSGYLLDCVELELIKSLDELEQELGESLDLTRYDHLLAYSNNILSAPQYFQSRIVYPEEEIKVQLKKSALFATNNFQWQQLELNLALRYDYDNFFENHNLAPRISLGYDLLGDTSGILMLGLNRYYDAGLLTYKIKELKTPFRFEYRSILNGHLQNWRLSSQDSDYRYSYEDINTPYNDEFVVGWKHQTNWMGSYSIKYIKRYKEDQLARNSESFLADDGYRYISQDNSGNGEYQRLSLSWHAKIGDHSLWVNASKIENYSSSNSYDERVDDVPLDQLVWYEGEIITKGKLNQISTNFSRPLSIKFGWSTSFFSKLNTNVTGTYTQGYDTELFTHRYRSSGNIISACPECQIDEILLPVYNKVAKKDRINLNVSARWTEKFQPVGTIEFRLDVSNLFNRRTYSILPGESGIETGRQLWFGFSYEN